MVSGSAAVRVDIWVWAWRGVGEKAPDLFAARAPPTLERRFGTRAGAGARLAADRADIVIAMAGGWRGRGLVRVH
jgi:hypothetical protein